MSVPAANPPRQVNFLCLYLFEKLIDHVVLCGGTHGNERVGVALVEHWLAHADEVARPTFATKVVLGNPEAVRLNRRYVDEDLNRCFRRGTEHPAADAPPTTTEGRRAASLDAELGPKSRSGALCATDFIIDLHSTTAAMGATLIVDGDGDRLALRVAAAMAGAAAVAEERVRLIGQPAARDKVFSMDSVGRSGLSVEVGPLAHGTLQWRPFAATRNLVAPSFFCCTLSLFFQASLSVSLRFPFLLALFYLFFLT
jgi:N-acyl-aromatic-L-amino acid amidohydrolase